MEQMVNPNNVKDITNDESLKNYIFHDRYNRRLLIGTIISILILITIYKYLFPYASFIYGDSYCYIDEAERNVQIDTYPIGYPMFLRAFSAITVSDTALVVFQYLLLQGGALGLMFSLFYIFRPRLLTKLILIIVTIFNPLNLHISNTVSSDNLFYSLSLIWFTLLLWLIFRPTFKVALFHALILFFAFTVRYNALFYPIIAAIGLFFSKGAIKFKLQAFVFILILLGSFIKFNLDKYYELCNIRQFTPFSGWLMANNAIYAYRYAPDSPYYKPPLRFIKLDNAIRTYFDSTRNNKRHPEEKIEAYHDYMWKGTSPLSTYWREEFIEGKNVTVQKAFAQAGPFFNDYGIWLIKHYPKQFIQHVFFPNSIRWFTPPVEFLTYYNSGLATVPDQVKNWFKYKSIFVRTNISLDKQLFIVSIQNLYPIWGSLMNLIFPLGLLLFIIINGKRSSSNIRIGLMIGFILWILNFGFSTIASPIALRYQMFPILMTTYFCLIIIDLLIREDLNSCKT
jgi:hypothetical protein